RYVRSATTPGWRTASKSLHLKGRPRTGTVPELTLRRAIHRLGGRYRLGSKTFGRSSPDLVFGADRVAVFVDGCFWHGCPRHGRKTFRGPNADLWRAKLRRNRARDRRVVRSAEQAGWVVMRVWECAVMSSPSLIAECVLAYRRASSTRPR